MKYIVYLIVFLIPFERLSVLGIPNFYILAILFISLGMRSKIIVPRDICIYIFLLLAYSWVVLIIFNLSPMGTIKLTVCGLFSVVLYDFMVRLKNNDIFVNKIWTFFALSLFIGMVSIILERGITFDRTFGPFRMDPNIYSLYILISFTVYCRNRSSHHIFKIVGLLAIFNMKSRTAILNLAMRGLQVVRFKGRLPNYFAKAAFTVLIIYLVYVVMAFLRPIDGENYKALISTLSSGRSIQWEMALIGAFENSFAPYGLDTMEDWSRDNRYIASSGTLWEKTGIYGGTHNTFLEIFFELGPIGLILYSLVVWSFLRRLKGTKYSPIIMTTLLGLLLLNETYSRVLWVLVPIMLSNIDNFRKQNNYRIGHLKKNMETCN